MNTVKITCGHKLIPGDKLFCNHCVDEITSLLGRERDLFGKRETELMKKLEDQRRHCSEADLERHRLEKKLTLAKEALEEIKDRITFDLGFASRVAKEALAKLNDEAK